MYCNRVHLYKQLFHTILLVVSHFTTRSKHNWGKTTKYKTTKCKSDKIQKDRIQIWQNAKRQNANMTKCKKTECQSDKTQKDNSQIWQNTKRQNTKVTIHNTTKYKYDKTQMWQITNVGIVYLLLKVVSNEGLTLLAPIACLIHIFSTFSTSADVSKLQDVNRP